jgi:hypothetical protein
LLLGFALGEMLVNLAEFGLGRLTGAGEGAARVSTAAGSHVAAFAHALEVHADFFGAGRLRGDLRGPKWANGECEKNGQD